MFIKGHRINLGRKRGTSWNKGIPMSEKTKKKISNTLKNNPVKYWLGRKMTKNHKKKLAESRTGEKNGRWLGNNVGYIALHQWVSKNLGKPQHCAVCKSTEKKMYHWANISRAYKRELSDWIRLCVSCHWKFDRGFIIL